MHQRSQQLDSHLFRDDEPREERFIDLEVLAAAIWRRAWLIALFAALGVALGVAYLLVTPPVYTAATRILIDENLAKFTQEEPPVSSNMRIDSMMSSEVEILKSAQLARTVVLAEDLQNNEAFLNPPKAPVAWLKSQARAVLSLFGPSKSDRQTEEANIGKATALLQQDVSAERVGRSLVIQVSFSASDPALAGAITRAYADAYLADQLEANFDATQRAMTWLQGRLDELRQSSQTAALEVEQYRAEHGLTASSGELISEQQLSDLNSQLILARAETANARARYEQFKSIIESGAENAVRNATIPTEQPNSTLINEMKSRYLTISSRLQDVEAQFGEDHPQAVNLRREQGELERQIFRELEQLTETYRNEYSVALAREESLSGNVGTMSDESSETGKALVKLRELEQRATTLANLYQTYLARYEEASQQRSLPIAKARVISQAEDPVGPSSPSRTVVLALSLVLGLFAGGGTAAFQEFRERFFRTSEDVRDALGLKFLGYLPLLGKTGRAGAKGGRNDRPQNEKTVTVSPNILRVTKDAPGSSFAETMRNTRHSADLLLHGNSRVIGFVSVLPDEGKTTVATNFACLTAASGAKTLLIDGDLRGRGLSRSLSGTSGGGLVEAIAGDKHWPNYVRIDRATQMAILPASGRHFAHTSELLSGPGMQKLIDEARRMFSYIVIDLPPLGPVIDAKAFEPMADGFVIVTEWGATPRALLRSTLQSERRIAAKAIGVILNKADMKKLARYATPGGAESYVGRYGAYYGDRVE
ncbi:Wzz/FepE/Etk N-terminal domain-containing protein [Chelativorans sp. M5D2P16]|uniref:Wzz/FepE/Etk N-terminal domain-containing protein n=1 Tax=Chelativorans sp. M5D2P16 TaxID=3095678 RepID=UPI002ACA47F4|nr:Wzz/FepE/Etk N-terminal domain-containing protein [Chelativorans sp. M5D2P16]MDZ5696122.1 Wzz/FepE/Etk N-terminal domain-containing protein [Chelativorans sp. M5D2P16]